MRGEKKLVARGKTASGIAYRHPVRREFARDAARYATAQRSAKPSKATVQFQGLPQIDDPPTATGSFPATRKHADA